ncbi:MAG: hypothetical protein AB4041_12550 [Microcystaceae cyanobacterium]
MNELPPEPSNNKGISWVALQKLSTEERHLINWIRRQKECSLLEVAVHLCLDEETAMEKLIPLIEKGYIQQLPPIPDDDEPYFKLQYPPKRGQPIFKKLGKTQPISEDED